MKKVKSRKLSKVEQELQEIKVKNYKVNGRDVMDLTEQEWLDFIIDDATNGGKYLVEEVK